MNTSNMRKTISARRIRVQLILTFLLLLCIVNHSSSSESSSVSTDEAEENDDVQIIDAAVLVDIDTAIGDDNGATTADDSNKNGLDLSKPTNTNHDAELIQEEEKMVLNKNDNSNNDNNSNNSNKEEVQNAPPTHFAITAHVQTNLHTGISYFLPPSSLPESFAHLPFLECGAIGSTTEALPLWHAPSGGNRAHRSHGSAASPASSHLERQRQQLGGHHGHPRARSRTGLSSHGHGHHAVVAARQVEDAYDDYDEYDQMAEEGDDCPEHHLGLLRVPCSIAINSEEASLGHHDHDRHSSQSKTAMAAYVDTGAQVTIISAAAAKRAGIYHLMDRRYAGRATGVGHCKVLGRIPARHVHFILGCDDDDDDDDDDDNQHQERNSKMVRMDGPALTVLEGTVTQGVDVLLGLDVLQDWEAEIRMGPTKSITVKKRRNRSGRGYYDGENDADASVVIPFATSERASGMQREGRTNNARRRYSVHSQPTRTASPPPHHHHRQQQQQHKSYYSNLSRKREDIDDVEDDYSPTTDSDIESDLDLLDRSGGREFFPDDARNRRNFNDKRSMQEMEDEILGVVRSKNENYKVEEDDDDDDDDDDYLRDVDEEDVYDGDDVEVDLSGL